MFFAGIGCYRREGEKMVAWLNAGDHKRCHRPDVTFDCDDHLSFFNSWVENRIVDILQSYAEEWHRWLESAFGGQTDAT